MSPRSCQWSVRDGVLADLDTIVELHMAVQQLHHVAEPLKYKTPSASAIRALVEERMHDVHAKYFVATGSADDVVGYLLAIRKESPDTILTCQQHYVEFEEISVAPQAQRRGVARALTEAATQWADRQGALEVRITVREFNTGALGAYESLGFASVLHRLERRLK